MLKWMQWLRGVLVRPGVAIVVRWLGRLVDWVAVGVTIVSVWSVIDEIVWGVADCHCDVPLGWPWWHLVVLFPDKSFSTHMLLPPFVALGVLGWRYLVLPPMRYVRIAHAFLIATIGWCSMFIVAALVALPFGPYVRFVVMPCFVISPLLFGFLGWLPLHRGRRFRESPITWFLWLMAPFGAFILLPSLFMGH